MSATHHSTWATTVKIALGAAAAVTVVLLAFAWPTYTTSVEDVPLTVVGPDQAVSQVEANLAAQGDAFAVQTASSRDDAQQLIKEREVYGAIVIDPSSGTEVLTATAASPPVSQMLNQLATALGDQADQQVTVTDVVPLSDDDPRGSGLGVAALPLAMGGMIGGVLISLMVSGARQRITAAALYGVVGGLALAAVLDPWFGFVQGSFWGTAAIVGLAIAATAATISGFHALMGRAGIAVGAVLTMFVGNPLSSASAPKEFLPGIWGDLGQFLVPGASSTLLRLHSYFPEAPTTQLWLTLAGWFALGVVLSLVGRFRDDEVVHVDDTDASETEPETAHA